MAITNYYVRATNGADVAGQGTTHATAYKTIQFALDDIGTTHGRNAVDGDQINICDSSLEGANVLAASLTLATYGTPTAVAPLILRGYTATANDGGVGEINCGGFTMWASSAYDNLIFIDMEMHTAGNNYLVNLDDNIHLFRCELHQTGVNAGSQRLLSIDYGSVIGCYLHDTGNWGNNVGIFLSSGLVAGCFVDAGIRTKDSIILGTGYITIAGNIVRNNLAASSGIIAFGTGFHSILGNAVYNLAAGTATGIHLGDAVGEYGWNILNNIVVGWSGVAGVAIKAADNLYTVGHNAFYNNTANYSIADQTFNDLTAHDVALAADPFVDAANGDFSLTDAAKTALAAKGWPQSYLGAHANTIPNLNIGPIQMAAGGGGGGPVIGSRIIRGLGAL